MFSKYYNVQAETVWEEGNYVLHKKVDDRTFAEENDISSSELEDAKLRWKNILLKKRAQRIRPNTDDKIITSWNALLINGFIEAHKAFGDEGFLKDAENIFLFLKKNNYRDHELIHTYKKGSKLKNSFIEDYAFFIDASLNLYGVSLDEGYLNFARDLNTLANDFLDKESKMYHYNKGQKLISRILKTNDGVIPSPNALMAHNLFKLGHIDYNLEFIERSKGMLGSMVANLLPDGAAYAKWLQLLLFQTHSYFEIAVVGENAKNLIRSINRHYIPNAIVVGSEKDSDMPLVQRSFRIWRYLYLCLPK